jgi:hypothetical protein
MKKTLKYKSKKNNTHKLRKGGLKINLFGKSDYDKYGKPRVFINRKNEELPFMYFYNIQAKTDTKKEESLPIKKEELSRPTHIELNDDIYDNLYHKISSTIYDDVNQRKEQFKMMKEHLLNDKLVSDKKREELMEKLNMAISY